MLWNASNLTYDRYAHIYILAYFRTTACLAWSFPMSQLLFVQLLLT